MFPLAIALAGVSLASKIGGDLAGRAAANKMGSQMRANAGLAYSTTLSGLHARAGEEQAAAQLEGQNIREMSLVEQGLAQASAADNNVAGNSVIAATTGLQRRAQQAEDANLSNTDALLSQLMRQALGAKAEYQDRLAGAPRGASLGSIAVGDLGFAAGLASSLFPKA